ncbi:uncharacterized protein LOC129752636 [Uranotaenia lowii]|uniref:uncharacterized protein LOC129752636 n=1 Tax=Uranotaenia lowii TaxID=190385 RepID=UPI0024791E00|nr:uncharacterized protein LOC129752636 [Uranotaenia lowii]
MKLRMDLESKTVPPANDSRRTTRRYQSSGCSRTEMMASFRVFCLISIVIGLSCASPATIDDSDDQMSFRNFRVYEIRPSSRDQLRALHDLASNEPGVDFWMSPGTGRSSSVMVTPDADGPFRALLTHHNISHQVANNDVQQTIDRVNQQQTNRQKRDMRGRKRTFAFDYIWKLQEIYDYLDYLAETYPNLVRLKNFGTTFEGRPLKFLTISITGEVKQFRPVVFVDGTTHAREWASPMAVLYLIHQLVENSMDNVDLLRNTDWVIVPMVNPDGYVYSHEKNRLWRKNRSRVNELCEGVDLNRNFPFRWSFTGAQCSIGYAGPTPASEHETRGMMLLMATYARSIKVYLAVHSCGDYILYPYGYDYVAAPNAADLKALGDKAAAAVTAIGGPQYRVGSASTLLYPANGSDDYIYGSVGVEYSYTLELSCGNSGDGFIITDAEMQKIIQEAFEMFKVFGEFASQQTVAPMQNVLFKDAQEHWGFQLYVVSPEYPEQLEKLYELQQNNDYDFWDKPRLNRKARVMVSNLDVGEFEEYLEKHDIEYDYVVENVQQFLDKERKRNEEHHKKVKRNFNSKAAPDLEHYWTLDEIYTYIDQLAATNEMVTSFEIGRTAENRPIKALGISKTGEISMERPIVFMDSGIHAREWAGVMSVVYMITQFVENSEQFLDQLENTDYVIIPVMNPDGYVYTHEENRLWRKNRVQNNVLCRGVDLNRNFPKAWAFASNECTNNFAGTGPSSEAETQAMMDFMARFQKAITMYIAVHTYGELILWPWGYDFIHCDNAQEHDDLGKQARDAIVAIGGDEWEVGNSADVLYLATGATDDYAYEQGARLAYTIELTGGGYEGFDLPVESLGKVMRETFEIFKIFGKYAGTVPLPSSEQLELDGE